MGADFNDGDFEIVPLGRIDFEAIRFFKVRKIFDRAMWILGENPQQAFGFVPKWVCPDKKVIGVAVRHDRANKGNLWGLSQFIFDKHGYNIEYQVSPAEEVQEAIERHFPERIPRQA